jgi:SAM-dependent methyltransferase
MTTTTTQTATAQTSPNGYALDSDWHAERARLNSLTELYDPRSLQLSEQLGLARGWRCLDIGAGTGSLVALLANRVGESGRVVAADINTRFLDPIELPNVDVLRLDVVHDSLPAGEFDLVHTRLLLEHLPQRDDVLRSLTTLLRPGGWLLIEDFDWSTSTAFDPDSTVGTKVAQSVRALLSGHGYDPYYGRRLPRRLAAAGLGGVAAHAESYQVRGSRTRGIPQWELLVGQLSAGLVATGLLTQGELDEFGKLCHDEDTVYFSPLMVSTWGQLSVRS